MIRTHRSPQRHRLTNQTIASAGRAWSGRSRTGSRGRTGSAAVFEPLEDRRLLAALIEFGAGNVVMTPDAPRGVAVGYFDAGDEVDLAVAQADGTVAILLGNGDATFTTAGTETVGAFPQAIGVG
ncbi:MAG: hypothetical protein KAS72_13235, partial [Phycisphaerales bacterium]|nr:hypothetical protein [Phycisphaerales bacterium]